MSEPFLEKVIFAILAAIPPTIMALAAFRNSKRNTSRLEKLHKEVNSRMTEMIATTKASSELKGRLDLFAEQEAQRKAT